jgi:endonuclease-3 related protein
VTAIRTEQRLRRTDATGARQLRDIYERLHRAYGAETWHWAPEHVRAPIDVIAGAVLVQHTAWQNAERALDAMRAAGLLSIDSLLHAPDDALLAAIRVSGTPTIKLRRLRALASTIEAAGGVDPFLALPFDELRARLLATHGVGAETADGIALYAGGRRVFMVDAYTQRLFRRIGIGPASSLYEAWRTFFEGALADGDVLMFQRYHAYIVLHGKAICRAKPRCGACVLADVCDTGRTVASAAVSAPTPA